MSKGWREVARLGGAGARYPHVLVDSHGWCLRLGSNSRADEKYYSSLPVLLRGLVEHLVRRRLMALSGSLDLQELCREVLDALHSALGLCHEALEKGGLDEHIRRSGAEKRGPRHPDLPRADPKALIASGGESARALRKSAV